jgi:hypothetical protein
MRAAVCSTVGGSVSKGDHGIQHIRAIDLGARGRIDADRGTDP